MPAGDLSYPYDVTLAITNGSTYGFMLTSPQGQSKQINFTEAGAEDSLRTSMLERLQGTNVDQSRMYSPTLDTIIAMTSFIGGCGQVEFDSGDDKSYWWSNGVVTHVDGKAYPAPPTSSLSLTGVTGAITGIGTYLNSSFTRYDFLWEGANLWRRDASNSTNAWTKVYTASATITDFKVMDDVGLIAAPSDGSTTDFWYQSNVTAAATWTPTAADHTAFSVALGKPKFWNITRGTCYAAVDKGKIYYTVNPTLDSWVGPIDTTLSGNISGPPGDKTYPFTGVKSVGDFLFIIRPDGIYSVDSQQDVNCAIWQWKDKPSEYNFKYKGTGGDQFLFSVGPEYYQYDPQTGVASPCLFARKDAFSVKEILGLSADNQYAYILARVRVGVLRSADSVALFRGVRMKNGKWTFEVLWEDTSLSGKTYGLLEAIPNGVGTRLYWGLDQSGDTATMIMDIPAEWDETNSGSFATSRSLWTSLSRSGFQNFQKHLLYYNSNGLNLDSNNKITVNYSIDGGSSFTSLTNQTSTNTYVDYTNINSINFVIRFDFVSAGSIAPILQNFDQHNRVRFKYLPQAKIAVRIADKINLRNSGTSNKMAYEIADDIRTLRESDGEITYQDFLGNSYKVTVDSIEIHPTLHQKPMEYEEEAVITITAVKGL